MELTPVRIWASPSTLHLKVAVTFKTTTHIQFAEMHIPLEELTETIRSSIALLDEVCDSVQHELELPYTGSE